MRAKKIIAAFTAASFLIFAVGCGTPKEGKKEDDLSEKIQSKVEAYQTDLHDSSAVQNSNSSVKEHLVNWAKSKGVRYTSDKHGNVIMEVPSSKKYKKADPTVILCPYDTSQFNHYETALTSALYIVKNNEKTGKLTVIFSPVKSRNLSAVKTINNKYFSGNHTKIFVLNGGQKAQISLNSAYGSSYRFTQKISRTKPKFKTTYQISYSGFEGGIPSTDVNSTINPIDTLCGILSSLKNRNIGYELAFINGGDIGNYYPQSASMTLTVDPDDESDLKAYLDKQVEKKKKSNEKRNKDNPAVFQYKKVEKKPTSVISKNSLNKFINFMYTSLDGEYRSSDGDNNDEIRSITSVTGLRTGPRSISILACASSLDRDTLTEIDSGEKTLAHLSSLNFRKTASVPAWKAPSSNTDFTNAVKKAYKNFNNTSITYTDAVTPTPNAWILDKNRDAEIISVTVTEDIGTEITGCIITYLQDEIKTDKK